MHAVKTPSPWIGSLIELSCKPGGSLKQSQWLVHEGILFVKSHTAQQSRYHQSSRRIKPIAYRVGSAADRRGIGAMVAPNRNTITLKGSAKTVTEFFGYAVNRCNWISEAERISMAAGPGQLAYWNTVWRSTAILHAAHSTLQPQLQSSRLLAACRRKS